MPPTISLTHGDLALAAVLVLALAACSHALRLGVTSRLLVAALRTVIQLALVGIVLEALFDNAHVGWVALAALVMLLAATREVLARQERRFRGAWGAGIGGLSLMLSTFVLTVFATLVVVQPEPWYEPRYAIPLLGMMIGNTMTGTALGMNELTQRAAAERGAIEAQLMLGSSGAESISAIRRGAVRTGMIPILNAMAAAGLISLPGMMTGQILAGNPPTEAVKYQILIMFLITAATGFGALLAVGVGARRLFDDRHRLRLDRLA